MGGAKPPPSLRKTLPSPCQLPVQLTAASCRGSPYGTLRGGKGWGSDGSPLRAARRLDRGTAKPLPHGSQQAGAKAVFLTAAEAHPQRQTDDRGRPGGGGGFLDTPSPLAAVG